MDNDLLRYFSEITVVEGFGLVSCLECGAAILLDPRDGANYVRRHNEWHERQNAQSID